MTANLNLLKPRVRQLAEAFVKKCAEMQLPVEITATFRTIAEQNVLYAKGRTTPGSIVTNAKGGQSLHNYGCAFDFVPLSDIGQPDWNGDFYSRGKIGEALGLEWGGDWRVFVDKAHLQFTAGYSFADFQNGHINEAKFAIVTPPLPAPISAPVTPQVANTPTVENLQAQVWTLQTLINLWTQLKALLGGKI